jgi:hypothetical protein
MAQLLHEQCQGYVKLHRAVLRASVCVGITHWMNIWITRVVLCCVQVARLVLTPGLTACSPYYAGNAFMTKFRGKWVISICRSWLLLQQQEEALCT